MRVLISNLILMLRVNLLNTCAGESLQDERVQGGAFVSPDGLQMPYKHVPVSHCVIKLDENL